MEKEVIDNADMAIFAEVGLILFVIAFVLIIVRVVFMNDDYSEEMGHKPLEGGKRETETTTGQQEVQT